MRVDYYFIVNIERDKITKLDKFISNRVLFAREVSLASFNSRANESLILARINRFSLILTIADKEIIKSFLSTKESRIFLITIIFNNNNVTIADLVKSFKSFLSLNILLFLLDNTSNRVISSIEDSKTIFA